MKSVCLTLEDNGYRQIKNMNEADRLATEWFVHIDDAVRMENEIATQAKEIATQKQVIEMLKAQVAILFLGKSIEKQMEWAARIEAVERGDT